VANRGREFEVSFRLDAELESSFRRSFGAATDRLESLDRVLSKISSNDAFGHISKEAREAERAIRSAGEDTRTFGDVLKRVAEYSGAFAIVQGVADSVQGIGGAVFEFHDSMAQLQAATGASAEEMEELRSIAESLYELPVGQGFEDLTNSIATVKQVTQQSGEALEQMTKEAILFRDVFGEDVTESVKAADTMMRNFGITSTQAFNLLAQGAQKGLDKSGELLDTANEYAPQFAALGYSADEMFNIFAAGLEKGAFNLDKVGDAVKEFNIRLKDGSKTTSDALAVLFAPNNIDAWVARLTKAGRKSAQYAELVKKVGKSTADEMLKDLKKGGQAASKTITQLQMILGGGQDILDGLSKGAIQGKDALQAVVQRLNEIKDPLQRNQLGVALFGTQFEDLEATVITSLGSVRNQFDMTKSTMEDIEQVKFDTVSKKWQQIGRQLMTELVLPISEDLMPTIEKLADWAGDNKELIKFLALATPAAMIGKNAVSLVSKFASVGEAVEDIGKSASGANKLMTSFGTTLRFFTNPVGIAVGAVGALTAGIIAYRKSQEEARQALLHMDETLSTAFKDYSSIDEHYQRTNNLIAEYDRLSAKIADSKTPTEQLTEARRKLSEIEKELIELNPEILNAEDAKSGKFREQLGLVQELNGVQREMARRELEKSVTDAEYKLPSLEEEYAKLQENLTKYDQAYNQARESYVKYREFVEQQQAIVNDSSLSSDEQTQRLRDLARTIQEITGKDYSGNWANLVADMQSFYEAYGKNYDKWVQTQEDIQAAEQSFQALYDSQKQLIELNLGGTLEEQAKKFSSLSEESKAKFAAALQTIAELNQKLNELPAEKKINVDVLYRTSGLQVPKTPQNNTSGLLDMPKFAEGGIATRPSIFGEAGPEMAIPLERSQRSRELLEQTSRIIGYDQGTTVNVSYSPVINVSGGGPEVIAKVKQAAQSGYEDFKRFLQRYERENRRLSFHQ